MSDLAKKEPSVTEKSPTAAQPKTAGEHSPVRNGHDYVTSVDDYGNVSHEDSGEAFRAKKAREVEQQLRDALGAKEKAVESYMNRPDPLAPPFGSVGLAEPDPRAKLVLDETGLHSTL
jgi:hypothetical protein